MATARLDFFVHFAAIVKGWLSTACALHGHYAADVPPPFVTSRTAAASPSTASSSLVCPSSRLLGRPELLHTAPRHSTFAPVCELCEPLQDLDKTQHLFDWSLQRAAPSPWISPTCALPVRVRAAKSRFTANRGQSSPQTASTSVMFSVRLPRLASFDTPLTRTAGFPDPFAVATISGEQTRTTSVIKKTLNPYWNESFDMCVDIYIYTILAMRPTLTCRQAGHRGQRVGSTNL